MEILNLPRFLKCYNPSVSQEGMLKTIMSLRLNVEVIMVVVADPTVINDAIRCYYSAVELRVWITSSAPTHVNVCVFLRNSDKKLQQMLRCDLPAALHAWELFQNLIKQKGEPGPFS